VASRVGLVTIAVDPHKRLNAVEVVVEGGEVLAQHVFEHSTTGFRELTVFARSWRSRQWAVEGGDRGGDEPGAAAGRRR
jgi:hypothetical protein